MKKVAIVSNSSWSFVNFRFNLIKEIKNKGYSIALIAPEDEYSNILPYDYFSIKIKNKVTNPIEEILLIYKFYRLYKKIKPDIILHFTTKPNIYGTIASKLCNIPCINNITGLGVVFTRKSILSKIVLKLYKCSQKYAAKVFFQNNDDLKLFLEKKIINNFKADLLPGSGVDTEKFKPISRSKKSNNFIFLLFGRMLYDKGVGIYVEAARILKKKYKNLEFQLLGFLDLQNPSSISTEQMRVWEKVGIINYLGTTDNVRDIIAGADCIVLPSFYGEGVPRSLLEAASMGKPIITTNNVGCREVIDDGITGFLCNPRDTQDLILKMEKMMSLSEKERIIMGKKGRQKILCDFNERLVIEKYIKLIEGTLS